MRTAAGVSEPRAFSGREIRLKVYPMCHNDDILFATLDCENDEKYYHHYPNWGTQNGDLEKIKIAPKLTWNFSFSGLKVQASLSCHGQTGENVFISILFTQDFSMTFLRDHTLPNRCWSSGLSSRFQTWTPALIFNVGGPKETDTVMLA